MYFSVMDLIGRFKPSFHRPEYIPKVIYLLTNYIWCIILHTKQADEVVHAYPINVYSKFSRSHTNLSDNESEFKIKLSLS